MTKHECRMTKEAESPNDHAFPHGACFFALGFVIHSSFAP